MVIRKSTELNYKAVEAHLREHPEGLNTKELAELCHYAKWTICSWLRTMEWQRRVVRPKKAGGKWTLPEDKK